MDEMVKIHACLLRRLLSHLLSEESTPFLKEGRATGERGLGL